MVFVSGYGLVPWSFEALAFYIISFPVNLRQQKIAIDIFVKGQGEGP